MSDTAGATDAPVAGTAIPGEDQGLSSTGHGAADYESIAREKGWKPKEDFEGTEDLWVGPEEFVKRQPLIDKIKGQSKKLKELEKTVTAMAKHYNTSVEQAKTRAIAELKDQRREAIEVGDAVKVDELDTQIEQVKKMEEPVKPTLNGDIAQFIEDQKSWFNVDKGMTRFAASFNEAYLLDHPGDMEKSLEETLKAVKKAYPDKFSNQRKSEPPPVDAGGAPAAGGSKYTLSRLTHEQKLVYEQLVKRHGQMSHDEYFKGLESAGYLEK